LPAYGAARVRDVPDSPYINEKEGVTRAQRGVSTSLFERGECQAPWGTALSRNVKKFPFTVSWIAVYWRAC